MWILIILLILLFFRLEIVPYPGHDRYILLWQVTDQIQILKISPYEQYVLVENGLCYMYDDDDFSKTFISSIRLDRQNRHDVLHYKYLIEQSRSKKPDVLTYSSKAQNIQDVLNEFSTN